MLRREFYVHFIARPRTKEYFDLIIHSNNMLPEMGYDESIRIYLDDYFWDDYEMNERSIYTVGLKIIVEGRYYWDSYHGVDEYDEDVTSEKLYMNTAPNFHTLREFLEDSGLVQRKERYVQFK